MRAGSDAERIRSGSPASDGKLTEELLVRSSVSSRIPSTIAELLDDPAPTAALPHIFLLLLSIHFHPNQKF